MNELTSEQINSFMQEALIEAKKAGSKGEVPIGAVLVDENNQIIARSHNLREQEYKTTSHAEINVIEIANNFKKNWRLEKTRLFVTVEPCLMCSGAILQARIPELYYGIKDSKFGAVDSLYNTLRDDRLNHQLQVYSGILEYESKKLMQDFFSHLRSKREKQL
ncbi:MAG: nucleoside deaminase [Lactobacillaceae bacterium]|jgi:tRNA(adenine34) deaminase|nr:nucleoside deaminase [Lactobacillaceae bacterium]